MVAENTCIDPFNVGIIKFKGLALGSITDICKESNLKWYSFRQWLIEHYSNVPYASDPMYTYSHLLQGIEEPTTQYLSRAKVLLEHIHHTTKLSSITGVGWENLYLVRGLKAPHMRRRVASEQDSWRTMEDVFNIINCISRTEDRSKVYSEPHFKSVPQVTKKWVQEVSMGKNPGQNPTHKTYNGPSHRLQYISSFRGSSSSQPHRNHSSYQPNQSLRKMKCYYCEGEHSIKDCKKFMRDKAKYKCKTVDFARKYKSKFRQAAKSGSISVNEIASAPE